MSKARTIFIMTHDSIGIGEDGPSHQPVEQIVSLRAMPEHDVWRPADGMETAAAYAAMLERGAASTIVLTRQKVARVDGSDFEGARRGGYVVRKGDDGAILATGSEVTLAVTVAEKVENKYGVRLRVISMPCWEAFEREKEEYRRMVLGVEKRKRVSVEAGSVFGWEKWADYVVGVEGFGRSGKGDDVLKEMGISQEKLEDVVLRMLRGEPKW